MHINFNIAKMTSISLRTDWVTPSQKLGKSADGHFSLSDKQIGKKAIFFKIGHSKHTPPPATILLFYSKIMTAFKKAKENTSENCACCIGALAERCFILVIRLSLVSPDTLYSSL